MIKRFEQHIKEAIRFKNDFPYMDNFQSIIDSWSDERHVYISNDKNVVEISIGLVQTIDEIIDLTKNVLVDFLQDLKIVLDSLEAYGVYYLMEINGTSYNLKIKMTFFTEYSFRIFDKNMHDYGYDPVYYIANTSKKGNVFYKESKPEAASNYSKVRIVIELEHNETETFNHKDFISKFIEPASKAYDITKSDYEDEGRWNYIIELKKK